MTNEKYVTEVFYAPDWHHSLSPFMGDLTGEIGYITEMGTVNLIGKSLTEEKAISEFAFKSNINGPTFILAASPLMGL